MAEKPKVIRGRSVVIVDGEIGDLRSLLETLANGHSAPLTDFGSAHFLYDLRSHLNVDAYNNLVRHANTSAAPSSIFSRLLPSAYGLPSMSDVISAMLRSETSLEFKDGQLTCPSGGRTRDVISYLVNRFVGEGKRLAIPLPNWHFWDLNGKKGPAPVFFNARNEEELVNGFEDAVVRQGAGALILVNPANPLMYEITEKAARAMNTVADKYGVEVIVDDVLRGTRPRNDRNSIGRWFDTPWIVEGFSKRFGEEPWARMSYVLRPESARLKGISDLPRAYSEGMGGILKLALDSCTEPAYRELTERNRLFDEGLSTSAEEHRVTSLRPFPSSLTSLLTLPADYPIDAAKFSDMVYEKGGVEILPAHAFYPPGYKVPEDMKRHLRITVGRIDSQDMVESAKYLGLTFSHARKEAEDDRF